MSACDDCLRRTDLLAALAGRIEVEWRQRRGRPQILALPDEKLLDWAGDRAVRARYAGFAAAAARDRIAAAGMTAACRCEPAYPQALHELPDPPAVLHRLGGEVPESPSIAIVGARAASGGGLQVAHGLARGVAAAGLTVVSGMALGIDAAAHGGALAAAPGLTVAVLAGGADVPYPPSKRALHGQIVARGAVVSELPPGFRAFRWCFPARNRIIAALGRATIVVEGGERSGSLITADFAAELGRPVGAVPGPVTARMSAGPNLLIKAGAELVRGPQDVLELVFGPGNVPEVAGAGAVADDLPDDLRAVLHAIEDGRDTAAELAATTADPHGALGELELRGLVRRVFGGRYVRAL